MLFGLTLLWTLLLFCNTENWGLGDFIRNGWKGLFGTFSYLDTPFSDAAAALKAEEKQKENNILDNIELCTDIEALKEAKRVLTAQKEEEKVKTYQKKKR